MSSSRGRAAPTLLRRAPLRLLAARGWALVLTGVAALLVASLVAPAWFVRAAEDAALSLDRSALDADAFGSSSTNLRVVWLGVVPRKVEPYLDEAMRDLPGYSDPVLTGSGSGPGALDRPLVTAHGVSEVGTLWTRDGAVETLAAAQGSPEGEVPPGVWLPQRLADDLDVAAGDEVRLSITPYSSEGLGDLVVPVPVAGVFDVAEDSAVPAALVEQGVDPLDHPWYPDQPIGGGTALVVADPDTFGTLSRRMFDRPQYTADMLLDADPSPAELARSVRAVEAFEANLYDPEHRLRAGLSDAKPEGISPQVVTAAPQVLDGARRTADQADEQVGAFVRATQVLALVLLLVALALLASRRALEHATLTSLGVRPAERVAVSVLEVLPAALLAVPLGLLLAWGDIGLFGPPGEPYAGGTVGATALRCVLAVLVVLAAAAGVAAWTGWRQERAATEPARVTERRWSVWQVVVVVAAGVVATAVLTTDVATRAAGPLTILFPIATAAGVAVVAVWLWMLVRPRLPRLPARPGSAGWLARSRTAARVLVPVTVAITVGLSVLGYGLAVRRGVADSVDDKAAALAGARTTADLGEQLQGLSFAEADALVGEGSAVVYEHAASLPPAFGDRPLYAVDPAALESVADWGATLGDDGRPALRRLAAPPTDKGLVPVVMVGTSPLAVGEKGELNVVPAGLVPIEVVAVVDSFPGTTEGSPDVSVVAPRGPLLEALRPIVDPRKKPDRVTGAFTAAVWSDRDARDLRATLEPAGVTADHVVLDAGVRTRPDLLASAWAVGYLRPLEVGSALLVLAAVVLLARRLLDRDAVTDLLLARMGWSRRELLASRAREVAGVLVLSTLAAAAAVALLVRAPTTIESVPDLPPLTAPHAGAAEVVVWLLGVVVVLVVAVLVLALGRRRSPEEVLRGNR